MSFYLRYLCEAAVLGIGALTIAAALGLSGCVGMQGTPTMPALSCPPGVNAMGEAGLAGGFGGAAYLHLRFHCAGPGAPATP